MQAFQLSARQISKIIVGVVVDELGARFRRYTDFLTATSWSEETALAAGGMDLKPEERAHCAGAIESFFGAEGRLEGGAAGETVEAWADLIGAAIRRKFGRLRFKPAGRAGDSPLADHAVADVFRDAAAAANLLHGRRRIVSLVAPQGFIGFATTVLAPNLLRIESLDARGKALDEVGAALNFGDALVATPTIWRYLIGEGLRAPDNSIGVVFGESLTAELGAEMRKAGFGAIRELYGSTESGLVAWRDTLSEPFTLFEHWKRDGDELARVTPAGEMRRPSMDTLEWINDRSFRLGLRRDGAVQIGAINVFPERIAAIVKQHASVESCTIRVTRQASGANRLVAHIQLKRGQTPNERAARDIDAWCRTQLRPPERPRIYNFEERIEGE
ncbi:MAG: hypothetical protein ABL957_16400 [Parvularculaceae bacterium]